MNITIVFLIVLKRSENIFMSILEAPTFKHKKILEKECKIDTQLYDLKIMKSVLNSFDESKEIIKPKIELPEDYTMPEWITCKHRMRRYEEGLGVQSYCLHPFNPLSTKVGLYLVVCNKRECTLQKYYDIF